VDWVQFILLVLTLVGLFIWNRTESRADARSVNQKIDSDRGISLTLHEENHKSIQSSRKEIQELVSINRKETQELVATNRKETQELVATNRKETLGLIEAIHGEIATIRHEMEVTHRETLNLIEAIRQDIKDFHGRLCAIEERFRLKP
jgi:hypothetical protein